MGIVYLARERRSGLTVAIKLLDARVAERGEAARNFAREARIVEGLDHPRIVRTLAIEEMKGRPVAIVSEFMRGGTLRAYLRGRGPLPFDRVVAILRDVAAGMAYAHRVRVVHRDVKPENIYLSEESGRASLGDFGLARAAGGIIGRLPTRAAQSQRSMTYGTPTYMAPEQVRGEEVDERADVYALALVGWEMLSGARPWEGEPLNVVLHNQQFETLESLATMRPDIPAFLLTALDGAMQKDPADRWSDGGTLLARLTPKPLTLRRRADESDALTEAVTIRFAAAPEVRRADEESKANAWSSDSGRKEVNVAGASVSAAIDDLPKPVLRVMRYEAPSLVRLRELGARIARAGEIEQAQTAVAVAPESEQPPLADVIEEPSSEARDVFPSDIAADVIDDYETQTDGESLESAGGKAPEEVVADVPNEFDVWPMRTEERQAPTAALANSPRPARRRRWLTVAGTLIAVVGALASVVAPRGLNPSRADRTSALGSRSAAGEVAIADSSLTSRRAALPNETTSSASPSTGSVAVDATARSGSATRVTTETRRAAPKIRPSAKTRRPTSTAKVRTPPTRSARRNALIKSKRKPFAARSPNRPVASAAVRDERCRSPRESDQEACLKLHTASADASMNDVYQRLTSLLMRAPTAGASRAIAVTALRSEQGSWERSRLTTCQRRASGTNNALWGLERAPCYAAMARQREAALRARLSKGGQGR